MVRRCLINGFAGSLQEGLRLVRIALGDSVDNLASRLFYARFFRDVFGDLTLRIDALIFGKYFTPSVIKFTNQTSRSGTRPASAGDKLRVWHPVCDFVTDTL